MSGLASHHEGLIPSQIPAKDSAYAGSSPECWFWAGWEPQRHYRRRGGSRGTFYFGNGGWIEAWERRLFSDETIEMASTMGATILVTQFYKGMGREVEGKFWPKLQDFIKRCHQHEIKVWGYVQGSSIYSEFLKTERKDLDDWIARAYDGSLQSWGDSYYRMAPCLTSRNYRQYISSIISEGVGAVGLDGIHMDNSYYRHCWCDRCQLEFREYLSERGDLENTTSILDVRNVKAPPLPRSSTYINDPLQIHWIKFGVNVRRRFYRHVCDVLRNQNTLATLSGNSAFPRTDLACELRLGMNPVHEAEFFDFCCAENGNQTRCEKGGVIGQMESFLFAEASNYRVWSTAWRHVENGSSPPPDEYAVWAVAAEEFSYGSAINGNNWALRPTGEKDQFLGEKMARQSMAFTEALSFFRSLTERVSLSNRKSWTDVGILVDPHSLSISGPSDTPGLRQLIQYFSFRKIPFQFVFPDREVESSITTVVALSVSCLSMDTMQHLRRFASHPGKQVVLSESTGLFDEWHVPYDRGLLNTWRKHDGFYCIGNLTPGSSESAVLQSSNYLSERTERLDGMSCAALDRFFLGKYFSPRLRFTLPENMVVHVERSLEGSLLVHLRDQSGSGKWVKGGRIWLSDSLDQGCISKFYSPRQTEVSLEGLGDGSGLVFELPSFQIYGFLVIPPAYRSEDR